MSSASFKGHSRGIRSCSGARFVAVSHSPSSAIDAHQHDWPNLTIHLAGACVESFDGTTALLDGPSFSFHPAKSGHADEVLSAGLETRGLLFEPAWLSQIIDRDLLLRPRIVRGGRAALAARKLVALWTAGAADEDALKVATARLFEATDVEEPSPPAWLERVSQMLAELPGASTRSIARSLDLHPAWLARSYRYATGEGLHETARRKRVERALLALRGTNAPLAEIALDAGFCDQPHMNRCFRQVLGESPRAYRLHALIA